MNWTTLADRQINSLSSCIFITRSLLLCLSMGSRSPASSSHPPAFFSKLTESNSAIVKSKKEMIKKMVVGTEAEFSELMGLNLLGFT